MFGSGRLKLFKAFGIQVDASWTFLLLLLIYGATGGINSLVWAVMLFASVIVHEFGHSLVARQRGVEIAGIELHFFGGVAKMKSMPKTPKDEILIAAAGPLTSFALGAVGMVLGTFAGIPMALELGVINIALGVFNLLPALPMDGGRIFRAALQTKLGGLKATKIASTVAKGLAVCMALFAIFPPVNFFMVLLAIMLWTMAGQELRYAEYRYGNQHEPGGVEVMNESSNGPIPVMSMFEQMGSQGQQGKKRIVMKDAQGRTIIIEEGVRW